MSWLVMALEPSAVADFAENVRPASRGETRGPNRSCLTILKSKTSQPYLSLWSGVVSNLMLTVRLTSYVTKPISSGPLALVVNAAWLLTQKTSHPPPTKPQALRLKDSGQGLKGTK